MLSAAEQAKVCVITLGEPPSPGRLRRPGSHRRNPRHLSRPTLSWCLGLDRTVFDRVLSILGPTANPSHRARPSVLGVVLEGADSRPAKARPRGPDHFRLADALGGWKRAARGYNVVLHEFAHQLDMPTPTVDRTPPLKPPSSISRWTRIFDHHYRQLVHDCQHGVHTLSATEPHQPGRVSPWPSQCFDAAPRGFQQHWGTGT